MYKRQPFSLSVLPKAWGWSLLAIVWTLASVGILMKARRGVQSKLLTISLYVAMGWLILVAINPLMARMPTAGLWLLLSGGLAYTGGLWFYALCRFPFHHLLWHLAVLVGTGCHYFALLWYVYQRE